MTRSTVGPKFDPKFGPKFGPRFGREFDPRFGREFGRVRGLLALAGVAVLAIACESDPEPIAPEDDQIVAARLDRARLDSNPIDATERDPSREDDSIPTAIDEAARLEAMRAMLESTPTASSTGSVGSGAGAGGDGASGSQGSGAGDASGGSDGDGEGESTGGSEGGSGSDGGASGDSSGSGSSTGAGGSAGESGATATGTSSNAGGAASGTGSSGTGGDASGGASGTGSESAGAAPSSGEASTGNSGSSADGGSNGGPTTAGGAGRGGGVGDTGTTTDRSTDFIEGVGGASGDAAGTGRGDPGFVEPEAMEGAGTRLPGGGGAAGAGSGEAFDAAGGAGGGGRSGGGGRDGGAAGGESSVAIDGETDGETDVETDVETETPTGVLEPGASSIDPEAPNERDDFLDAPVVLDLPTTPDAGPEGLESSEAAPEREGEDPRGGTGPTSPPNAISPSPELGVDGRRQDDAEDDAVEGAVGDPGAEDVDSVEPDAASEPAPTTAPEIASDPGPALHPDIDDEAIPLRERLAVPQVDLAPIETTLERREARSKEPPRDDPAWLLRGAWEQIDRDLDGPDFAPGGFERNVVAIDPREGTFEVYRLYRGGLVVAGAFRAEFLPEGTLLLTEDDGLPHRFPRERLELADGVAVEPPIEPVDLDRRWSLRDGVLEIEGRRFTRIDREAFERIARGDATGSTDGASTVDGSTAPVLGNDGPAGGDADSTTTASVDFFGTSIVGRYICYVVDISGSMAGPRLAAALDELARSIRALPPDRSFHVLFFSGGTLVLEDRWQRATSGRKRAFTSRFADIEAQGGTEPRGALEHAFTKLAPVPDEIHFMTDGQIPGNVVQQLRDLNGGRIRSVIHTYAFGDASGGAVLERIAGEHGGQYRFVPDRP